MVLSDLGGEALNKLPPLKRDFNKNKMYYVWHEQNYEYEFKEIYKKVSLTNSGLKVDGKKLLLGCTLNPRMKDVIMLILHGASLYNDTLPADIKEKCIIGSLMGDPEELQKFVKQSYIRISRQISGAKSNALSQIAQDYVIDKIKLILPTWKVERNGTIPKVSHTGGKTETTFDIVAISPNKKYFAIEVSFQFTTNSVIERKAGQAEARAKIIHDAGAWICYVIDGAGNINVKQSAVSTICHYSDCAVALSSEEIKFLTNFMEHQAGF
ncbi:restriction endonuclease [Komarekiella sp. 'clone 1']|uniref:Restriction endonuclease n=1 Tax=Komarekiella delphini-convector SJRDD-AB1 TaxID=2593771 RepID=A0AA40T1P4_9NOST|nr:restriction endonuclease [Komarekiella delphini-convector]MBD6619063.1 restriction endonuclease [Komarekiella delphini-convector SJRDD-AB1]